MATSSRSHSCLPLGSNTRESPSREAPQDMENGSHPSHGEREVAQIALADGLVDTTPESTRELADSAMLLSQGPRCWRVH